MVTSLMRPTTFIFAGCDIFKNITSFECFLYKPVVLSPDVFPVYFARVFAIHSDVMSYTIDIQCICWFYGTESRFLDRNSWTRLKNRLAFCSVFLYAAGKSLCVPPAISLSISWRRRSTGLDWRWFVCVPRAARPSTPVSTSLHSTTRYASCTMHYVNLPTWVQRAQLAHRCQSKWWRKSAAQRLSHPSGCEIVTQYM